MKKASLPVEQDGATAEKSVRWDDDFWQRGYTIVPNAVVSEPTLSTGAFRVYALFLFYAREDDRIWPGQEGLAKVSGMGERTVRTAIRELEDVGLLRTVRRGLGKTNVYLLLVPRGSAESADPEPPIRPIPPHKEEDAVEEGDQSLSIVTAWKTNSPPLIAHRDALFAAAKTKTKIRAALRVYPADVVAEAIRLYATVLAGDEYRWSYSWTLPEFLARGLDKFVPEANPLSNFRSFERQKPKAEDFPDLDELG